MRTFVLASLFLVGCGDKTTDEDTGFGDDDGGTEDVDGAAVYALNCSGCHGSDGGGVSGPDLTVGVPQLNDAALMDVLQNGVESMVAPNLTGPEEDALFLYLRDRFGEYGGA